MRAHQLASAALFAAVLVAVPGCPDSNSDEPEETGAGAGGDAASAALVAVLEKCDAADGKSDKTVSKCLTCNLGMSGSKDHAASFEGYTFHLCSARCKTSFDADPRKAVEAAKVP